MSDLDVNSLLQDIRLTCADIMWTDLNWNTPTPEDALRRQAGRATIMRQLFNELDEYMINGGVEPAHWSEGPPDDEDDESE